MPANRFIALAEWSLKLNGGYGTSVAKFSKTGTPISAKCSWSWCQPSTLTEVIIIPQDPQTNIQNKIKANTRPTNLLWCKATLFELILVVGIWNDKHRPGTKKRRAEWVDDRPLHWVLTQVDYDWVTSLLPKMQSLVMLLVLLKPHALSSYANKHQTKQPKELTKTHIDSDTACVWHCMYFIIL